MMEPEVRSVFGHPALSTATPTKSQPVGCKTDGCPCKDARVLSYRYLRFVKAQAESRGQTADRVIPATRGEAIPNEPEVVKSDDWATIEARPATPDYVDRYGQCVDGRFHSDETGSGRCRKCHRWLTVA
jgi:hypothetical protein